MKPITLKPHNSRHNFETYRQLENAISSQPQSRSEKLTPQEAAQRMVYLRQSGVFPKAGIYTDAQLLEHFKNQ
jgi:hypothetical protein